MSEVQARAIRPLRRSGARMSEVRDRARGGFDKARNELAVVNAPRDRRACGVRRRRWSSNRRRNRR